MAESTAFKDGINEDVLRFYGEGLGERLSDFDGVAFRGEVLPALAPLELKARVRLIAGAIFKHVGGDYLRGLGALVAMAEEREPSEGASVHFAHWPMAQYIEDYGLDSFEPSMEAMKIITQHFSCEFAVRPFLIHHQVKALAEMRAWASHPNLHLRRNASEGIRPRLPWGPRLKAFIKDPGPVFEILDMLHKDPEEYVRRSVSNCMNDVAKDHPEAVMDVLERWDLGPDDHSEWIKARALRTLIKDGNPRALGLLGFGPPKVRIDNFTLDGAAYRVGESLEFTFEIVNELPSPQRVAIDYRVHYVKAKGDRVPKVFKLKVLELGPKERRPIKKRQHLKPISTRRYHPGTHGVDIQVNGAPFGLREFDLSL